MSSPILLLIIFLSLGYVVWKVLVYPILFSPLSKIPCAHLTSSFSPVWILWKRYTSTESRAIHDAHTKHGPIVRLGPNELSVDCLEDGLRTVYGNGFEKWAWYPNLFQNFRVPCMFSMDTSREHSLRKRVIANMYSKSVLQSSPELHQISQTIIFDRLFPLLDHASKKSEPVEVLQLNSALAMDHIMAYIFGLHNGTNFVQDAKVRQQWLHIYHSRRPYAFWDGEMPFLRSWTSRLGWLPVVPPWVDSATKWLEDWTLEHCVAAEMSAKLFAKGGGEEGNTKPLVYSQLASTLPNDASMSSYPPHLQLASEVHDHVAAGQETTGITLTYLFHELSRHPPLQAALRTELLSLEPNLQSTDQSGGRKLPNLRDLDSLPFLNALILETLRIHSAIPGPQPRITPSKPTRLASHPEPLPGGVRVSAQAYSIHRNAEVFPDPEEWKPERWLPSHTSCHIGGRNGHVEGSSSLDVDNDGNDDAVTTNNTSSSPGAVAAAESQAEEESHRLAEMHRWFWAFGSGSRMCIGRHFAMQEIKLLTAAIYSNYSSYIIDDKGIEQLDGYTVGPKSNQLILGFRAWCDL